MKFFRKRKWTRNRLKMSQTAPFASFFRKFSRGGPRTPPPPCKGIFPNAQTTPHRSDVGLQPPLVVDLVSGSVTDNAMYIFNAILLKIQLSLSEFKRLYLHSRLHHFASFFQNFLGGGHPNPHQREGTPLPCPPHSALRASRKPPQIAFWIRHWVLRATLFCYYDHDDDTSWDYYLLW